MKIAELLGPEDFSIDLEAKKANDVLHELVKGLFPRRRQPFRAEIVKNIRDREKKGSTGIGGGIGLPHCGSDQVEKVEAFLGVSKEGIDFKALDGGKVYIFMLIIFPLSKPDARLKALAKVAKLLKDPFICEQIREAKKR